LDENFASCHSSWYVMYFIWIYHTSCMFSSDEVGNSYADMS